MKEELTVVTMLYKNKQKRILSFLLTTIYRLPATINKNHINQYNYLWHPFTRNDFFSSSVLHVHYTFKMQKVQNLNMYC